jgi:hypothetical protein
MTAAYAPESWDGFALAMAMAAFLQRLRPDDGTSGTGQYAVRMLVMPR